MRSEGTRKSWDRTVMLQYSTFSHGSEGGCTLNWVEIMLYIIVISHGSEGRVEEMICLKKVKIENGI